MRRIIISSLFALIFLAGSLTISKRSEADNNNAVAAKHYKKGKAAYLVKDFETAFIEFTEAYNISGKADLLYNLAVCSEKTNRPDKAIAFYELYLEEKPNADDIEQVKIRLSVLRAPIKSDKESTQEPVPSPSPKQPNKKLSSKPTLTPVTTEPQDVALLFEIPKEEGRKVFWPGVLIGGGGLILATGSLTAVSAYRKHSDLENSCAPNCTDSQVKSTRGTSVAADVQFILGGASVVGGLLWWWFSDDEDQTTTEFSSWRVTPAVWNEGGIMAIEGRF